MLTTSAAVIPLNSKPVVNHMGGFLVTDFDLVLEVVFKNVFSKDKSILLRGYYCFAY